MNALFIGRFQPFHNGHLHCIKKISKQYQTVHIGVGSSQYSYTADNPFTYDERHAMITESLEANNINNFIIVAIPDIHNPPKWVPHVLSIIKDFDVVYANNALTKRLFSEAKYKVKEVSYVKREQYSGRNIRDYIRQNKEWDVLVPEQVVSIIKESKGVQRIQEIS